MNYACFNWKAVSDPQKSREEAAEKSIHITSIMTQPEQPQKRENSDKQPLDPPQAIGVYDRPESKKGPTGLIIALVVIILLSLLVFWLAPNLF